MSDSIDTIASGPVIARSERGGPISGLADKLTSGGFSPGEFAMPHDVASVNGCCAYRGDDLELAYEIDDRALVLPPPSTPVCRRHGHQWQVQLGLRIAVVADSVGMKHLSMLLANPGREIRAVDLAADGGKPRRTDPASAMDTSNQPVLDELAMRHYRRRLTQLQTEIDDYQVTNDFERAASARSEYDWLIGELEASAGLGGRTRQFTDNTERARIAVGKAIWRAVERLAAADHVIGEELRARVQTGRYCCFRTE